VELLEVLAISFSTGLISSAATVAALKTEINWIKNIQQDQEIRIRKIEGNTHGTNRIKS